MDVKNGANSRYRATIVLEGVKGDTSPCGIFRENALEVTSCTLLIFVFSCPLRTIVYILVNLFPVPRSPSLGLGLSHTAHLAVRSLCLPWPAGATG